MKKLDKVIVFGTGPLSELIAYLLDVDSAYSVAAHTVDKEFLGSEQILQKKVFDFSELITHFSPNEHKLIIPIGWTDSNQLREKKFSSAKSMGYQLASYVSSRASIWPHVLKGDNVLIYEGAIIQPFVRLGDNIIIRSGANIGHHSNVHSNVFIASGVVTGGNVTIEQNASIGLGAIIRDGVRIGARCFIGAGALVTADTEPDGVYMGVPAKKSIGKTSLDVTTIV